MAKKDDYSSSFNEDDVTPPAPNDDDEMEEVAQEVATPAVEAAPASEAAPVEEAPAAAPAEAVDDAAQKVQQLKSWEGRLKAREAELNAREASLASPNVDEAQASTEAAPESKGEGESEGDPEAILSADFGDEFVTALKALIKKCVPSDSEHVSALDSRINELIEDIRSERTSNHFARIREAHENFEELVVSPEFQAWLAQQSEKEMYERVIKSGSAKEVVSMLNAFKDSAKPAEATAEATAEAGTEPNFWAEVDEAEGVRSGGGLKLPKAPPSSNDFSSAFNEED